MQKTLLLLFFFSCLHHICAQEITVTPNPALFEEDGLDLSTAGIQNITYMNVTGISTAEFAWIKVIESAPEEWEFAIGDINQGYFPEIDTVPVPMVISAGQDSPLVVTLRTNGVAGCGTVRLDIGLWDDDGDHEAIYSAYYEFKVNNPGECLSSINETIFEKISLSPNPTSDFFTIKTDSPFTKIRIIDTSGRLVKVFSRNDLYDISELEEALYFVEIFNDYEKIAVEKIIRY